MLSSCLELPLDTSKGKKLENVQGEILASVKTMVKRGGYGVPQQYI